YCLPYSRVPLVDAIDAWRKASRYWATEAQEMLGRVTHLESFAGCMMGQLCNPSLLVALGILEGYFFVENGITSLSLSYAQGTNHDQDVGALLALRQLAGEYFHSESLHIVLYTWMGVFPHSAAGAKKLIVDSARLAVIGKARRLIVKTTAEAFGIPTIADNLNALRWAREAAQVSFDEQASGVSLAWQEEIYEEARELVEAVLSLNADIGQALSKAFANGFLDVPYCLHRDNANRARAYIDPDSGEIRWQDSAGLAFRRRIGGASALPMTSKALLNALSFYQIRYA
ncbi:MAG: hypothetical protein ACRERV_15150, partial [Methylococcales bacterium]